MHIQYIRKACITWRSHTIVVGRMTQVKEWTCSSIDLPANRMAIHRMADRAPRDKILKLNVGGVFYTTAKSTLTCVYGSYLWKIATGDLYVMRDEKGSLFIDRDGYVFRFCCTPVVYCYGFFFLSFHADFVIILLYLYKCIEMTTCMFCECVSMKMFRLICILLSFFASINYCKVFHYIKKKTMK